MLWQTLTDKNPSYPLDLIRARWRQAWEKDIDALTTEITAWQSALWRFVPIGSYRYGNMTREVANDPAAADVCALKWAGKPVPGQSEVVLYLASRELSPGVPGSQVIWHRPRFEAPGKAPLFLRDYAQFGLASRSEGTRNGLAQERFGRFPDGKPAEEASLVVAAKSVTEVRLPAALFRDRQFVVEGKLDGPAGERLVQLAVTTAPPGRDFVWDGKSPVLGSPRAAAFQRLLQGHAAFRRCFPWFVCFPNVVPTDEVVCLKMFHREDEPLERLFLDAQEKQHLDCLWREHRFITQQQVAENNYLPQFIGFVTQDQPKELLDYFLSQRPVFQKRADDFQKDFDAAIPRQLEVLADFASRAFRRPLQEKEKTALLGLYRALRKKGVGHEDAFRGALARVLVSPAFLFRVETAPPGTVPGPINDWELATRLSYFLWSSLPDEDLRRLAAAGKLREPQVLAEQTRRMLKDDRLRALAIEFGTQWIYVRNFDELKEKNEKLFPTFNATLRAAIYEESILFFQDLFQNDRTVTQILDADYTFLNETLAKHYGIPGVTGPHWRRVDGVRKYGRGGILGLASVHAKQSGASRTSPVLRGNWVVETLLGEKLPRPPANVPVLPDDARRHRQPDHPAAGREAYVRRLLCRLPCADRPVRLCLRALRPDRPVSLKRSRRPAIDAQAEAQDGTEFDGIEGLRDYLLTRKKDVIVRLFCQKLLGYAAGSGDRRFRIRPLIEEMMTELNQHEGRVSAAVLAIVRSPQFRSIRGRDVVNEDQ